MKPDREHSLYLPFATALRDKLRGGYSLSKLQADLLAGITVGIVAVPLAMALAIGSGVPPQYGLYTAIVAGLLIALTGIPLQRVLYGPAENRFSSVTLVGIVIATGGLVPPVAWSASVLIGMGLAADGLALQLSSSR